MARALDEGFADIIALARAHLTLPRCDEYHQINIYFGGPIAAEYQISYSQRIS